MTSNRIFDAAALKILQNPGQWKLISSSLPREVAAVDHPRHQRWMRQHTYTHPHFEFFIASQGTTFFGVGHRVYPCRPGYVFFIKPYEPHDYGVPPWTPPVTHLRIKLVGHKITASLSPNSAAAGRHAIVDFVTLPDMAGTFHKIQQALAGKSAGRSQVIRLQLISAVFVAIAQVIATGYQPCQAVAPADKIMEKLMQVCECIAAQVGKGVNVTWLAQTVGYGRFHLMHAFKRYVGVSVHTFIDVCRLGKTMMLRCQGLPDKAIAAELGFTCPATFSRWLAQKQRQAVPMSIASPFNTVLLAPDQGPSRSTPPELLVT